MGCQSFAIDLPSANINAALSDVLTVTDVADHGDGYLPVDARRTLIRPEREWRLEWEGVGALGKTEEGNSRGDPGPGQRAEMREFSLAFFDFIEDLPLQIKQNKQTKKTPNTKTIIFSPLFTPSKLPIWSPSISWFGSCPKLHWSQSLDGPVKFPILRLSLTIRFQKCTRLQGKAYLALCLQLYTKKCKQNPMFFRFLDDDDAWLETFKFLKVLLNFPFWTTSYWESYTWLQEKANLALC